MHRDSAFTLSRALAASTVALAFFAGCGGGGASSALPNAGGGLPSASSSGRITQKLSLLIPAKGFASSRRSPQYTSIATKGIGISLVLQGKSAPTNPATLTSPDVAIDLTTTPISIVGDLGPSGQSISCTTVTTPQPGQNCTLALSLPTDVAEIVVNAWDAAPATGSTSFSPTAQLLSSAVAAVAVSSGAPGPTIALVLDGIPAALRIVPAAGQSHFVLSGNGGAAAATYTEIGSGLVGVTFDALDADGNIIIGNGAPTVQWQIAQNGTSVLSGNIASGLPTNLSIAPFLTNAAAFASSFALTATASTPSGSPLSTSIAIQPAQELWLPGNSVMGATTGRGPQAIGGASAATGYEIPPSTGALMSPVLLGTDTIAASSLTRCPNVPAGSTPAPFNIPLALAADPTGNLWLLVATPYSSGTGSGQASCAEGFAVQNTANPPQPLANSLRLLSSTDTFTGCAIDRFDTLWCVDSTADTLVGYDLQAAGTAPFSTPNVTLPISLPPAGAPKTPIAIAVQPGGTNLWLAMAASAVGTATTTTFYARAIPITTASSSAPSLGTPSNWAQFGNSYVSTDVPNSAIPVPDPPLAVDANDNIYSVDVGNESGGPPVQAPLIAMWQPSLGGGNLSFGTPPNASTPYLFVGSGQNISNVDEPFAIAPDGTLWAANSGQNNITPYAVSSGTLTVNALLGPISLPLSPLSGFTIAP
ncbi:MAG: hypothetical protein PXZ07_10140 [Candidatus Eremiobacteraeota bacterium]|nr:hypothetical protein [Candidatus Eremiobacteraeota bacterium]